MERRLRDPELGTWAMVVAVPLFICLTCISIAGALWAASYYTPANGLFAVGSLFGLFSIVWTLWCAWILFLRPRAQEWQLAPALHVSMPDLAVVLMVKVPHIQNMRGKLVKVEPASEKSRIVVEHPEIPAQMGVPSWNFPGGLLRWSNRYGGSERTDVVGEADLDVLEFRSGDPQGRFVYVDDDSRQKVRKLFLEDDLAWRVTLLVYAETGEQAHCSFKISKGVEDMSNIWLISSPHGPLYRPEISESKSW